MDLATALKYLLEAETRMQTPFATNNPSLMSKTMARMSTYAGVIEEKLAEYERNYEIHQAQLLKKFMINEKLSVTAAEKRVKIEIGDLKGQIMYLSRIIGSAWRQIGVLQSRINHLIKMSETTNL